MHQRNDNPESRRRATAQDAYASAMECADDREQPECDQPLSNDQGPEQRPVGDSAKQDGNVQNRKRYSSRNDDQASESLT